ncbi:uncharacterized protein LOC124433357 [Xenia sp. Carnegie-2017]|uniref:uncharacterized protein LOC124433357 n=1 Tax=Xenia sp. Carnegie-2017 TaxID=2897299 RepID=UPI001F03AB0B|nr:uncharacterized protein LOC124433357 [Xenia sp. Carnegie-2017]
MSCGSVKWDDEGDVQERMMVKEDIYLLAPMMKTLLLIIAVKQMVTDNQWPRGNFGLPKATTGCPGDWKRGWREGWRFQDMQDGGERSMVSIGNHMAVTFLTGKSGVDITRAFCLLDQNNKETKSWPKGTYCIYKSSIACPYGMSSGSVKWDDENNKNTNKQRGQLPDGVYDNDTLIHYCYQTNGNWYDSIELPVIKPFYLLTSNSLSSPKCQMVKWATSQMEYILFDTEDENNSDIFSGNHVFVDTFNSSGRIKLYYCYYKDCCSLINGTNGSIYSDKTSQNCMDPQSQYCSWLITVAETFVISLTFSMLNIPQCNDTYLYNYNGPNIKFPLLGKYCKENATAGMEIRSSTNHLYIIGNSGSYGSNQKSVFRFRAKYIAHNPEKEKKSPNFSTEITGITVGVTAATFILIILVGALCHLKQTRKTYLFCFTVCFTLFSRFSPVNYKHLFYSLTMLINEVYFM